VGKEEYWEANKQMERSTRFIKGSLAKRVRKKKKKKNLLDNIEIRSHQ
jgi:hypothetical protein